MLDVHAIMNFTKLNPSERKETIKSIKDDREFKIFYEFIIKNKLLKNFMCRKAFSLLSLDTKGNYLHYFYIMLMSNSFEVNFEPFFDYYDLNNEERDYISRLFYIDVDYKMNIKPADYVKNILDHIYSIEDIITYISLKFENINSCRLYKKLQNAFNYLQLHPNTFNILDKNLDKELEDAFKHKFDEKYMNKNYPTKTSSEPVIGLAVKRLAGSTITSPIRTIGFPLTKTVEEPVIEIPLCVSPVTGCVCESHLSPVLKAALPLTKTSSEPETDFLGIYGGCPEQRSPTRTAGLDIIKTPDSYKSIYKSIFEIEKERIRK